MGIRRRKYPGKMEWQDILQAVDEDAYRVDLATGEVLMGASHNGKGRKQAGQHVYKHPAGNGTDRIYVELFWRGKKIKTPRARVVWIVGHRRSIPRYFDIHHRDEDSQNDTFNNLICIYCLDHSKLHNDGVPF